MTFAAFSAFLQILAKKFIFESIDTLRYLPTRVACTLFATHGDGNDRAYPLFGQYHNLRLSQGKAVSPEPITHPKYQLVDLHLCPLERPRWYKGRHVVCVPEQDGFLWNFQL